MFRKINWSRLSCKLAAAIASTLCLMGIAHADEHPISLETNWMLQDAAHVPEGGAIVSSAIYQPKGWYAATVPGTVLTSLVNDGVYPEPLYGENNRLIPESLNKTSYWYRTKFVIPTLNKGKHVWLRFDGINYKADVWVNGQNMGQIAGAFTRGIFDVTNYIHLRTQNTLAVQILPPPHPGVPHEQTIANGVGPNGGISAIDGPTFLCAMGWDWIPGIRDRDMGIWQPVLISTSGPVVLQDPYVTSILPLPRTDTADLTVETTVRNVTDQAQVGTLIGTFGQTTFKTPVMLAPRETRTLKLTSAEIPQLHLRNPNLWWPNGYGPQNLYTLHLRFDQQGIDSDTNDVTFGVRQISYKLPDSDNLALSVNGVPVMCKGGDWGMDEALKRISKKRLEAEIRMHRDAHYTMIRNWVGQSTSKDFYDLCDQYGIMLWDEFFQPNPGDGPNPEDKDLYLANVREKILRFRSHPCIAVWCGRNEGNPPPDILAGIQKLMDELERQRLFQPSSTSGRGVNSGGPYFYRTPKEYYNFGEAFKTEIGSVSVPTLESVRGMMPERDWGNINDDWAEHDLARGAQGGDRYPGTIAARFGRGVGLEDFVREAQLANYEAFRAMYEGRFAKLFQPASGVITWMSNPAQPSFVWQLYSYDLEPNASLFATRKACEPIHIMMNQANWHVMVINNTPQTLTKLTARTSIYNLDGAQQSTHDVSVTASPSAATDLGVIDWPTSLSQVHFVRQQLLDAQKHVLSENFYWRALPEHEGDFSSLQTLPSVALSIAATRHNTKEKCLPDVSVRNSTRSIALMAHLQLRKSVTGERVLPVYYSDNYISLLPGESRTISIEASASDVGNAPLAISVDGWNVTAAKSADKSPNSIIAFTNPNTLEIHAFPKMYERNINVGGGPVPGFAGDVHYEGGNTYNTNAAIDVSNVAGVGPKELYQSERWGPCQYSIPAAALPSNKTYTIKS